MTTAEALAHWTEALSPERVISDPERLAHYADATFVVARDVLAVLKPRSTDDVQRVVAVANRYRVPLYPISRGRNWGLGSRLPSSDGQAIVDLSGMDRIVDFDDELGTLRVQPGVSFESAAELVNGSSSRFFLPVIGGPPDSSLIGNALERGDGLGPHGNRWANCCDLEVVLGDGRRVRTGFSRFEGTRAAHLAKDSIGPSMEGLFAQGNFGIVTEATFWLTKRPNAFQALFFTAETDDQLSAIVDSLRELVAARVVLPYSVALWNAYKSIASFRQYPWELTGGKTPLSREVLNRLPLPWGKGAWVGVGAMYSASPSHAKADRRLVRKALGRHTSRLRFLGAKEAFLATTLDRLLTPFGGLKGRTYVELLYRRPVFLGHPANHSSKSLYWRKRSPAPDSIDPHRDGCGLLTTCSAVPFRASDLLTYVNEVERCVLEGGFEPNVAFVPASERLLNAFVFLIYDREVRGEDERALACHEALTHKLHALGYAPYRLGIQSMANQPLDVTDYDDVLRSIKQTLDPRGVIAPGRYETADGSPDASQRRAS